MSNEQIYDVLINQGGQILRFAMQAPIIEFWGEPENQAVLREQFTASTYLEKGSYNILEIKPSELFGFFIYSPKK